MGWTVGRPERVDKDLAHRIRKVSFCGDKLLMVKGNFFKPHSSEENIEETDFFMDKESIEIFWELMAEHCSHPEYGSYAYLIKATNDDWLLFYSNVLKNNYFWSRDNG